jgi:HlyD family secretion protein
MSTTDFDRTMNGFKPDAVAIEEAPVSITANAALYTVAALLAAAVVWAVVGTLDRIVVAPGKIATRAPMLVMQPYATARILSLDVKPGDHVVKGQVLARFDPTFSEADVSSLQQKVDSLTAMTQRLEAQLRGQNYTAGPDAGTAQVTQAQIFVQEQNNYNAELSQRDARLAQIESQIQVDQSSLPGIRAQLSMAGQVNGMYERLRRQQAAATLDILRSQSSLIDAQNRLHNTEGDLTKFTQQHAEIVQERQAFIDKWRADHNHELVEARQNLAEAVESLNKANRLQDFSQLTAPVDGTVQDVADRSTGSVLREAEQLMTLVPDTADLYIEANVPARDVSYLKLGDSVRIKLESYPFQRFGTLSGSLTVISPDSAVLKEGEDESKRVYHVQVRLNENLGALVARGIHIKPGLVASAEIKTGGQTIAAYILHPVLRISDEAMREP